MLKQGSAIGRSPHRWQVSPTRAIAIQRRLSQRVQLTPASLPEQLVGLDCAFLGQDILAVAVVWNVAERRVVETRGARMPVRFPYVPGLLSFREVPVLLAVLRRVRSEFSALMCDGQGVAHPRRFGLASHLGVIAGMPAVGCAKSKLCGEHVALPQARGEMVELHHRDEVVGFVVRTRSHVRPVYVSAGHLCSHEDAARWVLACGAGYRLPEPTRLADRLVAKFKNDGRFRGGIV